MSTPVAFESSSVQDFLNFIPEDEVDDLIQVIDGRLGTFPFIGKSLPPPEAFARTTQIGKWRVYYEVTYGEDGETPVKVGVLRVVPAKARLQIKII